MTVLLVAMGGAFGASLRYLTVQAAARAFGAGFPHGTLLVNVVGSLLMGIAAHAALRGALGGPGVAFAMTGVLGGFTTFSAFSLDAVALAEAGRAGAAAAYAGLSVALSLGALFAGLALARSVMP